MSRYLTLVLTGVSAVALSTVTAPVGRPAAQAGSHGLTPTAVTQLEVGQRVGNWCC